MSVKKETHEVILDVKFSVKVTYTLEDGLIQGHSAGFNYFLPKDSPEQETSEWQACLESPPIMESHRLANNWPDYEDRARVMLSQKLGRPVYHYGEEEYDGPL